MSTPDTRISDSLESAIAELVAKQEITDVVNRRARAGDRRDVELALSCYHPGATEDHEGFAGDAADFIENRSMIAPGSKVPVMCLWHFNSNILITLDGDQAHVESYNLAVVIREYDGVERQCFIGGRCMDRFAFRDRRWAIVHRSVVFDWSRVETPSETYWGLIGLDEAKVVRGEFGAGDPLYRLLDVSRGA